MTSARSCEIYIDGASHGNPGPAGIGVVIKDAGRVGRDGRAAARELSHYIGETTNNVAEYLALVYALQEALQAGYRMVSVRTDSELLARQVSGVYRVRDPLLKLLHDVVHHLMRGFTQCSVEHIPRTKNAAADRLAGRAASHRTSLL